MLWHIFPNSLFSQLWGAYTLESFERVLAHEWEAGNFDQIRPSEAQPLPTADWPRHLRGHTPDGKQSNGSWSG